MDRKKLKWWMVMATVLLIVLAPVTIAVLLIGTIASATTMLACDVFGCDYPEWVNVGCGYGQGW